MHAQGIGALYAQGCRDTRFVVNLDEEDCPTGLYQKWPGRTGSDLDAGFGVDGDSSEAEGVENRLHTIPHRGIILCREGPDESLLTVSWKGVAEELESLSEALDLCDERLGLYSGNLTEFGAEEGRTQKKEYSKEWKLHGLREVVNAI